MWNEAVFWPAFKDAGMLVLAHVVYAGSDRVLDRWVGFSKTDIDPVTMVRTSDFPMEFQHGDLPELAEGDQVEIDDVLYRVRELPRVEGATATGFFRIAKLTRVRNAT